MLELFDECDAIYCYSREMAIEDGYLVDVSEAAREAGFRVPVALTRAVWDDCVSWSAEDDERKGGRTCQDVDGRLFDLYRVPVAERGVRARRVTLAMHIGGGDDGEPVITIMQPDED